MKQSKVSWIAAHNDDIKKAYEKKIKKRLNELLGRWRKKGTRPFWIGEDAWAGLLVYWNSEEFKKLSIQNKTNRASTRGGAVHTSGRKSHVEVAHLLVGLDYLFLILLYVQYDVGYLFWDYYYVTQLMPT